MISLSKYINIPVFIAALVIGIIVMYVTMPDTRKIFVYPSPENIDILQYRDKTGSCFSMKQTETPCPKNEKDIAKIPVQT
jgi:hypothetical protein